MLPVRTWCIQTPYSAYCKRERVESMTEWVMQSKRKTVHNLLRSFWSFSISISLAYSMLFGSCNFHEMEMDLNEQKIFEVHADIESEKERTRVRAPQMDFLYIIRWACIQWAHNILCFWATPSLQWLMVLLCWTFLVVVIGNGKHILMNFWTPESKIKVKSGTRIFLMRTHDSISLFELTILLVL